MARSKDCYGSYYTCTETSCGLNCICSSEFHQQQCDTFKAPDGTESWQKSHPRDRSDSVGKCWGWGETTVRGGAETVWRFGKNAQRNLSAMENKGLLVLGNIRRGSSCLSPYRTQHCTRWSAWRTYKTVSRTCENCKFKFQCCTNFWLRSITFHLSEIKTGWIFQTFYEIF